MQLEVDERGLIVGGEPERLPAAVLPETDVFVRVVHLVPIHQPQQIACVPVAARRAAHCG